MTEPSTRQLRLKVFLLAGAPLLAALVAIAVTVWLESGRTTSRAAEAVQPLLRDAREAELRNYVGFALQTIHRAPAPEAALEALRHLDFGSDGYFYILRSDGMMLLHSREPEREGVNHRDDRAGDGSFPIRQILERAELGGGFVEYLWRRPSSGVEERKLGYVATVPALHWIVGSGIYIGSLDDAAARVRGAFSEAIERTLGWIALIAALCAVVVAAGGFALNLSGQRLAESRLRALAKHVVVELEAERRRLARKLHDDAPQELAGIKLVLEVAHGRISSFDPSLGESLRGSIQRLQNTVRGLRDLSHELRPAHVEDDLPAALTQLLLHFEKRTGVTTRLEVDAPGAKLPEVVSVALYRVTGEALLNVEKHARAAHVELRLEQVAGALDLWIRDDGCGFDLADVRRHSQGLGLVHMTERVAMLGGKLTVRSDPRGTELHIHLPKESLDEYVDRDKV
jgi:two-component system NarL family sensor kinase